MIGPWRVTTTSSLTSGFALDADDFLAMLGLHPSLRREVLAFVVELLDENVFHRRPDIGEAPGHVAVVPDDHVGHARKGHAHDVEVSADQVRLVPGVGQAQIEVHVVRQKRLAGDGVSAGDDPVIRAGMEADFGSRVRRGRREGQERGVRNGLTRRGLAGRGFRAFHAGRQRLLPRPGQVLAAARSASDWPSDPGGWSRHEEFTNSSAVSSGPSLASAFSFSNSSL